jgi:hypothetical protein
MGIDKNMPEDQQRQRIKALAAKLGTTYQAVMKLDAGTSKAFSAANNARAARLLEVDPDWLALGEGEMRTGRVWPFGLDIAPADYARLPDDTKRAAIAVLREAVERLPARGKRTGTHG